MATIPSISLEARENLALWFSVLAAPAAWMLQLATTYALVPIACHVGRPALMHLPTLLFLVVALASVWGAWRAWGRANGTWARESDDGQVARIRFLAAFGLMSSMLFTLVIVGQWVPAIVIDPCLGLGS